MSSEDPDKTPADHQQQHHERQLELIRAAPKLILIVGGFLVAALLANQIADFAGRTTKVGIGPLSLEAEAKLENVNEARTGKDVKRPPLSEADQDRILARYKALADKLPRARLLWVDDEPGNNAPIVDFLDEIGAHVDIVRSYDEALAKLQERSYDTVVSDYSRPADAVEVQAQTEQAQFWGSGAQLARAAYELSCRRVVILFSTAGPDLPVPPYVFAQTNDPAALLNYVADMIDRQDDQRCE